MGFRYEMVLEVPTTSKLTPNNNGADGRYFDKGAHVVVDTKQDSFYKVEGESSWISIKYLTLFKNLTPDDDSNQFIVDGNVLSENDKALVNSMFAKETSRSDGSIDNMRYLFGAPMQYSSLTDPRPPGSKLGRVYLENLVGDMSLLTLTPGKAEFMKYLSKDATKKFTSSLVSSSRDDNDVSIQDLLTGKESGRYYSFGSDYVEYMKYVNGMCRTSALLLDIGDKSMFDGAKPYKDFDWDLNNLSSQQSTTFSFLSCEKSVSFFVDGKQTNFNDGINNSTGESMLSGMVGKGSDIAKEAQFLFGKSFNPDDVIDTSQQNLENSVSKVMQSLTRDNSIVKQLTDQVSTYTSTMIHGGNVAFPELWKDSSYNKSYDISLRLVSPYGDKESIYIYILVPLFHLMALAYPRQLGANGYANPFLVRAFCKG